MMNQRQREAVNRIYHALIEAKYQIGDPAVRAKIEGAEVDCVMITSDVIDKQD